MVSRSTVDSELDKDDRARVLAGDPNAFAGIVSRWQGPLYRLAYRFCRDRQRAEDMTQEAFLRVFRSLAQWRGKSSFSTWIIAVSLNAYRSNLRSRPASFELLDVAAQVSPPADVRISGGGERRDEIHRLVSRMPEKYRDALTVYYFQELDLAAAAKVLSVREGPLKARLHRARKLLESMLARREPARTHEEPWTKSMPS